jgi:uncharacterized protein (DUF1501 family)
MDGLTMMQPLEDPVLDAVRPDLVADPASSVPAGEGFGLHPAMTTTAGRLAAGQVALVPASGLPGASRSHFSAQFAVERCNDDDPDVAGGWIGRHLAATGSPDVAPFRAVSLGQPQVPALLAGTTDVLAARSLSDVALATAPGDPGLSPAGLAELWAGDEGALGPSAGAALEALARVTDMTGGEPTRGAGAVGAGTAGDAAAAELVTLFNSAVGTEVGMLNLGGWDHHRDLGAADGTFATLAGELDAVLDRLLTGIAGVTVLVVSEFGRRVAANDSGGSDHGRGGLVMALGSRVRGGVHGDWPGLDRLDEGDVPIANDVRVVFAEVAERLLGADPAELLPGTPASRLGVLA